MTNPRTRRQFVVAASTAVAGGALLPKLRSQVSSERAPSRESSQASFRYCLNTSTVREQNLGIEGEIEVTSQAGYTGIEPWVRTINAYKESGGRLADLKRRLDDHGLAVESAIGFAQWIVDDPAIRAAGLEEMKRDMETVAALGGGRIAAPPFGAHAGPKLDLDRAAERYHAILEIGRSFGVTPMLEVWGPSANLHRLGQSLHVASESAHPDACLLLDIYHIYRGGSRFEGLTLLGPNAMPVLHLNDYPAEPVRSEMNDSHRVMPGDGIAPFNTIIKQLHAINPEMVLSLELFNRDYWQRPALEVARRGLEKMKRVVGDNL